MPELQRLQAAHAAAVLTFERVNHTAELGFRVAQHVAGRRVATATVRELCQLAARRRLRTLRAAAARRTPRHGRC